MKYVVGSTTTSTHPERGVNRVIVKCAHCDREFEIRIYSYTAFVTKNLVAFTLFLLSFVLTGHFVMDGVPCAIPTYFFVIICFVISFIYFCFVLGDMDNRGIIMKGPVVPVLRDPDVTLLQSRNQPPAGTHTVHFDGDASSPEFKVDHSAVGTGICMALGFGAWGAFLVYSGNGIWASVTFLLSIMGCINVYRAFQEA